MSAGEGQRCVCGDPIVWMDNPSGPGWIHAPGSDTTCLQARKTLEGADVIEQTISELVVDLRGRLNEDERLARARWNRDGATSERFHGTPYDPPRVLREVAAKRALLNEVLGWPHASDCWVGTPNPGPCDCGWVQRTRSVVVHLMAPYRPEAV